MSNFLSTQNYNSLANVLNLAVQNGILSYFASLVFFSKLLLKDLIVLNKQIRAIKINLKNAERFYSFPGSISVANLNKAALIKLNNNYESYTVISVKFA